MKTILLALVTLSSSLLIASAGDLDCEFHFYSVLENKDERFNKIVPINSEANAYKLGNMFIGISAELPKNVVLSKVLTMTAVGFFESEEAAGVATSRGVLIGEQDMPASFSFSRPSFSLAGAMENYNVNCRRLTK
jgi:hypothetical protein